MRSQAPIQILLVILLNMLLLILWSSLVPNIIQGQLTRNGRYPQLNGRRFCGALTREKRFALLQGIMPSRMKRYGVLSVLLVSCK
jgi:hypothetical protein